MKSVIDVRGLTGPHEKNALIFQIMQFQCQMI